MSSSLRISADTSEVKKSILDLSKSLKNMGSSKVAIFSEADKNFIKVTLKQELNLMKVRIKDNAKEIHKMVDSQREMVKGSQQELELRGKILDAYKTQTKLARDSGELRSLKKGGIPGGGGASDLISGLLGKIGGFLGGAALGVGAFGLTKGIQASNQYVASAPNRNRAGGLGVGSENFGSPERLARAGLSEEEMIDRVVHATSILGRTGTSTENELKKAQFERAYGLQSGALTNVSTSLRGQVGGAGANEAQSKLQASILASGIEDALGPYLETMTSLLGNINENGMTNTTDLINLMSQMTKDTGRTPEQLSKLFQNINSGVQNSTGEANAFFQTAFSRAGIGGNTVGGAKFAIESGGIFGLNQEEMGKKGYNPELLKNLGAEGQFGGVGQRTGAILDLAKQAGGLGKGQGINDISNTSQFYGMNSFANKTFGTKGAQGFEALKMLQDVQDKKMSQQDFQKKLEDLQKDPQIQRLDKINDSLAGQTEILGLIESNQEMQLGKETVKERNILKGTEIEGVKGATGLAGAINKSGVPQAAGGGITDLMKYSNRGGIGEDAYNAYSGITNPFGNAVTTQKMGDIQNKIDQRNGLSPASMGAAKQFGESLSGKDIGSEAGKALADALKKLPPPNVDNNITIKNSPSFMDRLGISNRTYK